MKMKQLLCLLVLAVSGNTFGSNNTMPTMNVTEMTNQHFAPLMQGMPTQHPAMMKMNEICKMLNADLMKQCMQCMQDAHKEGVNAGLTTAGTHMKAMMNAMGNVVNAPKTDMATIAKAQGFK